MLQAAKRAGAAAIGSGGGQEDRCRTATPMIQTLVMRRTLTIGGCLTATPSQAGCAGSERASNSSGPDAFADWHGDCGGGHGGAPEAGVPARPADCVIGALGRRGGALEGLDRVSTLVCREKPDHIR